MNREDAYLDRLISIVDVTKGILAQQLDSNMPWLDSMDELAELFEEWGFPADSASLDSLTRADIQEALES